MPFNRESQLFQKLGRAFGVGCAVTRRIVRWNLDQLRQELDLGFVVLVDIGADLVLLVGRHGFLVVSDFFEHWSDVKPGKQFFQ
jgi:hypothetical protein